MYATPIAYPAEALVSTLPEWAQAVYYLNPMAGVAEGYRWAILGNALPSQYAYISFALVAVLFVTGLLYFKKVERILADLL